MKGGDILDFSKQENLRKGGVDLEKGGLTLLTNYGYDWLHSIFTLLSQIISTLSQII